MFSQHLEEFLHKAIASKETETAIMIFGQIQKSPSASLSAKDKEGKTFLAHALSAGAIAVAEKLFEYQSRDDSIIYGLDNYDRSLIWYATNRNQLTFVSRLIELSEKAGKKLWLLSDRLAMSPLHVAARLGNHEIVDHLLKKVCLEKNAIEIINQTSICANTPLHQAFTKHSLASIASLVNAGADISIHNDKLETPFDFIRKFTNEDQMQLFLQLNDVAKMRLVDHIKRELIKKPSSIELWNMYFRYAQKLSLKELVIANLEYHYMDFIGRECFIKDDTCELIPNDKSNLLRVSKEMHLQAVDESEEEAQELDEIRPKGAVVKPSHEYQLMDQDRVNIRSILTDIERYIADVKQRPLTSPVNRSLSVLLPLTCLLVAIGIMTGLYYAGEDYTWIHSEGQPDEHTHWNDGYSLFYILSAGVAFMGVYAAEMAALIHLWDKEATISHRDWNRLLGKLNKDVVDKIHSLEQLQLQDASRSIYLPTNQENQQELKNISAELNHDHTISQTLALFVRLQYALTTLQMEMNKSHRSLSLFAREVTVIDMDEAKQEKEPDEIARLLANG